MRAVLLTQAEESGCERVNSGVLLFAVKPASKPASIIVTHMSKYNDYIPETLLLTYYSSLVEQERRHRCESIASQMIEHGARLFPMIVLASIGRSKILCLLCHLTFNADRGAVQPRKDNRIKIYGTFIAYKNIRYANERITDSAGEPCAWII
jgi:hypothetical protein